MTSEIKPEDVKLPEPEIWVDGAALRWLGNPGRKPHAHIVTSLNVSNPEGVRSPLFTADQVRAAVLAERERCTKLCWDRSDDGDGSEWDSSAIACAERIRSGHSVTETKRD